MGLNMESSKQPLPSAARFRSISCLGFAVAVLCLFAAPLNGGQSNFASNGILTRTWSSPLNREQLNYEHMQNRYAALNYSLASVREGDPVPRLYLPSLPHNLKGADTPDERKQIFLRVMLPLVLAENEKILVERRRLKKLAQWVRGGRTLSTSDYAWAIQAANDYDMVDFKPYASNWKPLIDRVDVVPVSLALAQAAVESGWGTSRFARLGNAVFGQRTWDAGAGMTPFNRDQDDAHEVRAFGRLSESVHAYLRNLNTHDSYEKFRIKRAASRANGLSLNGYYLARFLDRYSLNGKQYVADVREVIEINILKELDNTQLLPLAVAPQSSF